jgi:nucleoside-diphosphate-sugar epimerase
MDGPILVTGGAGFIGERIGFRAREDFEAGMRESASAPLRA